MPNNRVVSPARSQGNITTPKRKKSRGSRSVCSPALSTGSGRLTSLIDQFKNKNRQSFALSPLNSRSILNDNTDIEEPRRKSWWKKLDENSQTVMEVLEDNKITDANNLIEELIDIEVLSQEKKNFTLDLPESSDNESINSIVLPQRKLFTQKESQPQKKFGQLIGNRESLAKLHKPDTTNLGKTVNVGARELFQNVKRTKPIFPAALLQISPNKTAADKTKENLVVEPKPQIRNIFGNRPTTKRKNIFAEFIVSESEDEIPDIQPKVFGFQKKLEQRRLSSVSKGRDTSPTTSITTDMEMDDWKHLPSSTMVENQLEDMVTGHTPVKRARLSKLSEAKESEAGTYTLQTNTTGDKTKQSNKSTSSKNKFKSSPEIKDKTLETSRTTRSMVKNTSLREKIHNTSKKQDAKGNKSQNKTTKENPLDDSLPEPKETNKQALNKSHKLNLSKKKNSKNATDNTGSDENVKAINNETQIIRKSSSRNKSNMNNSVNEENMEINADKSTNDKNPQDKSNYGGSNDVDNNQEDDDDHNFTLQYENDDVESEAVRNVSVALDKDSQENETKKKQAQISENSVEFQRNKQNATEDAIDGNQENSYDKEINQDQNIELRDTGKDESKEKGSNLIENQGKKNKESKHESNEGENGMNASKVLQDTASANDVGEKVKEAGGSNIESDKVNASEEDEKVANASDEAEEEANASEVAEEEANASEEDEEEANRSEVAEEESNASQEDEEEANASEVAEEDANASEEDEEEANASEVAEEEANASKESEEEPNASEEAEEEPNASEEDEEEINKSKEDEDEANESQEIEAEVNESQEANINPSQEIEEDANESRIIENDDASDTNAEENDEDEEESINQSREVSANENEVESEAGDSESEDVEHDQEMDDSDEADKAIATDAETSGQDDNDEMEVDDEDPEPHENNAESGSNQVEQNGTEPSDEVIEESPDVTHDTTGRNRKKDLNRSPEAILNNRTNLIDSLIAKGRNTSARKTEGEIKNLNIRPSLAPQRDSVGFSDGAANSTAEGSGWDSHRTTRKTLRQTFGKDFTPRKSLRALVMEKSAKRQTEHLDPDTIKFPQANSTEIPGDFNRDVEDIEESDHEVSRRTRQTTLEAYLQKIKQKNLEQKVKMEEAVRNSLKGPSRDSLSLFKVPNKPAPRRPRPTQSKQKKQIKSIIPFDELPSEVIADMKYKPPKRFQPANASWITKRLYKFLENKLEAKYDYKARVRAEKLVETIYHFTKDLRRHTAAPADAVNVLKHEMARLDIVHTHFEFYEFFHEFMPREIRVKVVPDIVNNIPLPRHGVFSEIMRDFIG